MSQPILRGVRVVEEIVWLPDEHVYGILLSYGAFVSKIRYHKENIAWEVYVPNDEFEIISGKEDWDIDE